MVTRTATAYAPSLIRDANLTENLNRLIEINRDAVNGYTESADLVENESYVSMLQTFATERQQFVRELSAMVVSLGDTPEDNGNLKGLFHRLWMNIKTAVDNGDESLFEEIARGEESAIEVYQDVLETEMDENTRTKLVNQLNRIREAHRRIQVIETSLDND